MNRIERLREHALRSPHSIDEFHYRFQKSYEAQSGTDYERYAAAFKDAFEGLTPYIHEGELIVGTAIDGMSEEERAEWVKIYRRRAVETQQRAGGGQDSHMAPDLEGVLRHGLFGYVARIDGYLLTANKEQRDFYVAAKKCLLAVCRHAENYAVHAEALTHVIGFFTRKRCGDFPPFL